MHTVLPDTPGYFFGVSVVDLGKRLRKNELTSVQLTQAALDSIGRLNPLLNAFVHVNREGALAQARQADQALASGADAGPLHGIPVAIKDNIDTFDMPTTYGSAHFAKHRPPIDARCVARLREAGAVILGKTLTHEFAYGPTGDRSLQGAAHNPWNLQCMTGGSSAGSAAAVAAGLVPLAVGTDTGGSIRIPSALCGTVGFKPSFDAVSVEGVFALSSSLDHVGPIANHVEDAALLFQVLSGQAPMPSGQVRSALRLGWIDGHAFCGVDPRIESQVRRIAGERFAQELKPVNGFEQLVPDLRATLIALQRAEAYAVHAERMKEHPGLFEQEVRERLELSAQVRGWEYVRALQTQLTLKRRMAELFEHYDLLVMPTLPVTAPLLDQREIEIAGQSITVRDALLSLTSAWNVTGLPAISIPAGRVAGLPVGLQVIAPAQQDAWLLGVVA
ncbi:amidase [Pseudomonas sp. dw_612]|uniref:amidase n=1 Tax=Pseudomonas sp. dw_612 TaxID=2720080 RepID=UPI001BD560EE|nr:amidase [Pseudomonas sp. dw_612]